MSVILILSLLVIAVVTYTQVREGIVGAFSTCVAALISGMIAFEFWPNLAWQLGGLVEDTFLEKMEDAIVLVLVFGVCVALLRIGAASMTRADFGFSPKTEQLGGIGFGIVTGYLVSGFLVCVLQTLPWHENFLGFEYDQAGISSRVLPADQVWLKLMLRANRGSFDSGEDQTKTLQEFSKSFGRERRYNDSRRSKETAPASKDKKDSPPPKEKKEPNDGSAPPKEKKEP